MPETPRTDKVWDTLDEYPERFVVPRVGMLIAEMLERIAIALEKEAKE